MKVSSVGPTYARCPLLSELALPGLSRRRVAAVWYPVKRRALIGSREALDVRPARLSLRTILLRARFAGRGRFLVVFAAEHLGRVELDVSISVAYIDC